LSDAADAATGHRSLGVARARALEAVETELGPQLVVDHRLMGGDDLLLIGPPAPSEIGSWRDPEVKACSDKVCF